MAIRAVFFDAGNTLLELNYPVIADRLRAQGHAVTPEAVRAAECRARVRLDPHLGPGASTESRDIFRLYTGYLLEGLGIARDGAVDRLSEALREYNPPVGLWDLPAPEARSVLVDLAARGLPSPSSPTPTGASRRSSGRSASAATWMWSWTRPWSGSRSRIRGSSTARPRRSGSCPARPSTSATSTRWTSSAPARPAVVPSSSTLLMPGRPSTVRRPPTSPPPSASSALSASPGSPRPP